ncbi:lipase secretion chaperone [Chromobacterium sp. Beijing]|uniref:lipase secretion chaperone n=1 Tax=Chromobacterium sp. Beijing TaxID=2735795 RepID=UPI001F4512AF|nr:lipase secretion chaperone [Chromobacterium sp. Beijing]UJB30593.1 lipase chaperone [Chromobacterium sp. Beijing]
MLRAWMGWGCALLLAALGWLCVSGADDAAAQTGVAAPAAAPSLRGTQADGRARVEASGALRVDAELRRLFDYQLATLGERDLPAVRKAVQQALQSQLGAAALGQALALFDRYVAYRRALSETKLAAGNVAEGLQRMRALRLQFLSASEVAGLFGDEDVYDDFTVQRLRIAADAGLSAEQKAARLKALEAALPAELRAARQEPVKHLALAEAEAALRKKGGGEQELYALRAGMVGQAAADRLSQLDREQAQWQARIDGYRREAQRLRAVPGLDAAQRQQALTALRAQRFNAQEQLRLDAFLPPQ